MYGPSLIISPAIDALACPCATIRPSVVGRKNGFTGCTTKAESPWRQGGHSINEPGRESIAGGKVNQTARGVALASNTRAGGVQTCLTLLAFNTTHFNKSCQLSYLISGGALSVLLRRVARVLGMQQPYKLR